MQTQTFKLNKVFAFFLKENNIQTKMKKEKYGYRTLDNKWKIFENSLTIIEERKGSWFNGHEYEDAVDIITYKIELLEKTLRIVYLKTERYPALKCA